MVNVGLRCDVLVQYNHAYDKTVLRLLQARMQQITNNTNKAVVELCVH
jgi:hypothetical protein